MHGFSIEPFFAEAEIFVSGKSSWKRVRVIGVTFGADGPEYVVALPGAGALETLQAVSYVRRMAPAVR